MCYILKTALLVVLSPLAFCRALSLRMPENPTFEQRWEMCLSLLAGKQNFTTDEAEKLVTWAPPHFRETRIFRMANVGHLKRFMEGKTYQRCVSLQPHKSHPSFQLPISEYQVQEITSTSSIDERLRALRLELLCHLALNEHFDTVYPRFAEALQVAGSCIEPTTYNQLVQIQFNANRARHDWPCTHYLQWDKGSRDSPESDEDAIWEAGLEEQFSTWVRASAAAASTSGPWRCISKDSGYKLPTSPCIPVEGVVLGQNDGIAQNNSGLQSSRDLAGPQADLRSMGSMCLGADQPSVDCRSSSSTNDPFGSSQRANELFRFVESLYSKLEYATIDGTQALVDLDKNMSDSPICQRQLSTAFFIIGNRMEGR